MNVALPTRKHCSRCRRWLLCCTNFRPAERRGDCVVRLQSHCNGCVRAATRVRVGRRRRGAAYNPASGRRSQEERNERRRWRYARRKGALGEGDPLLPIDPLRSWLNQVIMTNSISGVARQLHADPSFVARIWRGVYLDKQGRWQRQLYVRLSLIDRWMTLFGEDINEWYPWEDD